jgi:hypothetical protein
MALVIKMILAIANVRGVKGREASITAPIHHEIKAPIIK